MSKRKTSKDYYKEHKDLLAKVKALEARIQKRTLELCVLYPEIPVDRDIVRINDEPLPLSRTTLDFKKHIEKNGVAKLDRFLEIMEWVEEHIHSLHPYKQSKMFDEDKPKTYLKDIDFTEEEQIIICSIINRFGTGEHAVASENTIKYFTVEYLIELLPKVDYRLGKHGLKTLTAEGEKILQSVKEKVTNFNKKL